MIEQYLDPRLDRACDTVENGAELVRVAADLVEQFEPIDVGLDLYIARIRQLQDRLGGEHHGAAADKITEHHSEHEGKPRTLQDRARAIAMSDMAHLVADDAGEFVRAFRFLDQAVEHIDVPARQSEGVGFTAPNNR